MNRILLTPPGEVGLGRGLEIKGWNIYVEIWKKDDG